MVCENPIRVVQQSAAASISISAFGGALQMNENKMSNSMNQGIQSLTKQKSYQLTVWERMISASTGAILTSLLVTPFDVVKTRLQASRANKENFMHPAQCPHCSKYILNNGLMEHEIPKSKMSKVFNCDHRVAVPQYRGTWDAMVKISRNEGVISLYNGLPPTLLMAVPATVLYFATYDYLREYMQTKSVGNHTVFAPLLAGSGARILAATAISPLELMRTKMQSINNPPSMMRLGISQVKKEGMLSLWKGLSPTLWRDVPFSAIYWVCVENFKSKLYFNHLDDSSPENLCVSFVSGAGGGMIAATITHPFDVIKTQKQMINLRNDIPHPSTSRSTFSSVKNIIQTEGPKGLFIGLFPRLAKIMPACAIMLSSYEFGKHFFESRQHL